MSKEITRASSPNFAVHTRSTGSEATVALSGELDLASVAILEVALHELELTSMRRAVLDLESLTFIDASGLRQILNLHWTCVEHAVTLTIKPGPRGVQRIFELTHCDEVLPFAT